MVKIQYITINFRKKSLPLINKIIQITDQYYDKGYKLTVRQTFYQLLTKNIIENIKNQYERVSGFLTDLRMTGKVHWDVIEDRVRDPMIPNHFENIKHLLDSAKSAYRLDRWKDQEYYVEVWVEKEALAGILEPIANEWHVLLLPDKGYSSTSTMYAAAERLIDKEGIDKKCVILYLGDHDPSGEDMVRDILDRLAKFGCSAELEKIALTMDQIRQYNLPPNRTKRLDPRSKNYIKKHGRSSWELDALTPETLRQLLEDKIKQYLDMEKFEAIKRQEEIDKKKLEGLSGG